MINFSDWKAFEISEILDGTNTGNILAKDVEDGTGSVPYVTSSAKNNGVVAHIKVSPDQLIKGHCILVGGKTFTLTYQEVDFVSNDSHNIVLRLKDKQPQEVYMFLITVIRSALSKKYEWNDAITKDKLLKETILLPAHDDTPDWEAMISTINKCRIVVNDSIDKLKIKSEQPHKLIDISAWKCFITSQIFHISQGTRLRKQDMIEGNINYIGASAFNNGVTAKIGNKDNLHPGGTLTVCYNGSIGQTFYQTEPFWASDDVNVLSPIGFQLTPNIAQFLRPIILQLSLKYAYTDKWTAQKLGETLLPLPVNEEGQPDWTYMENHIAELATQAKRTITLIEARQ